MRVLSLLVPLLAVGCTDPFWGGQSGSEVTSLGECVEIERQAADDGFVPDGWDIDIASLRRSLNTTHAGDWQSQDVASGAVQVELILEGGATVLSREPNRGDGPCDDLVESDARLVFEGEVQGSVAISLSASDAREAEIALTEAPGLDVPVDAPSGDHELRVQGRIDEGELFLSFTWFDGVETSIAGQLSSD